MKLFLALSWLSWLTLGVAPISSKIAESDIRFQIKNAGLTVNGTFSKLEAAIQFDPAHLNQARIWAAVPTRSIQTGIALRDKHLLEAPYFDAQKYPAIVLQSKAIRALGAGTYEGTFDLTLKGTTREVKMPFSVSAAHEFSGQFQVNRLDFEIGKRSLILSNTVAIAIRVKLAEGS